MAAGSHSTTINKPFTLSFRRKRAKNKILTETPIYCKAERLLNWKKLDTNLREFANSHGLELRESSTHYLKGETTIYHLVEDSGIFYEIKHTKPIGEYGSKLRIYSRTEREISVQSKSSWLKKPTIKTKGEVSSDVRELAGDLTALIGFFSWETEIINPDWPEALRNFKCLKFECSQIDLAVFELERIRELHLGLLNG